MSSYWTKKLEEQTVRSFVGRAQEIEFFRSFFSSTAPEYLIVHISGVGGVGKTTLIDQVEALAKKKGIIVGRVNEAQRSVPDLLAKFAEDFRRQNFILDDFARLSTLYNRLRLELQGDPQFTIALRENSGRVFSSASSVSGGMVQWNGAQLHQILTNRFDEGELRTLCFELKIEYDNLPGEGKSNKARELLTYLERRMLTRRLIDIGKKIRPDIPWGDSPARNLEIGNTTVLETHHEGSFRFLDDLFQRVDDLEYRELLLNADFVLTQAFVADISRLIADRRVVLVFDTYEYLATYADGWLRYAFLQRNIEIIGANLTIICLERERLASEWQMYLPITKQIELTPFSPKEAEEFLRNRGIRDSQTIQALQDLSGNLPLMLALLSNETTVPHDELFVTQSVIERFLKWVPEQEAVRREAVIVCAFPRFFDENLLASLLPGVDGKELFSWLCKFSFTTGHTGRWRYHPLVRRLMIQYRFDQAPEEYAELQQRLVTYYESQLYELGQRPQHEQNFQRRQMLELEWLYHKLCLNQGLETFLVLFLGTFRRSSYAQELVDTFIEAQEDLRNRSSAPEWYKLFRNAPQCRDAVDCAQTEWLTVFEQLAAHDGLTDPALRAFVDYERGYFYVGQKRYLAAEQAYLQALATHPDYVSAYNGLGTVYRLTGQFAESEKIYRRCIDLAPSYIFPYYNLARLLHRSGRDDEAEVWYRKARDLRPNMPATYFNYANFLQSAGRYNQAEKIYRQAIEMAPHHVNSYINLGIVLQTNEKYEQAVEMLKQALSIDPNSYLAHLNLGLLHMEQHRSEDAIDSLRHCIELDPSRLDAYIQIARLLERLGRDREALGFYRQAIRLVPEHPALRLVTAEVFERLGRYAEAVAELEVYIRLNPDDQVTRGHMAELQAAL